MDLNARPTRNFWDIFRCCQNGASGEDDENSAKCSTTDNYAFTPVKLSGMKDVTNPSAVDGLNTPTTVATAGEYHVSFTRRVSIQYCVHACITDGEDTSNAFHDLFYLHDTQLTLYTDVSFESYDSKSDTITEGNKIFDDDLSEVASEETEQESKESARVNNGKIASLAKEEQDDVPDMDSYQENDTATQTHKQAAASEVSFVHFFIFMIFRHIFGGPLLVKAYKQKKKSYWEKFLSLTYLGTYNNKNLPSNKDDDNQSSKDSLRTMKLRQLKLAEGKCEVYPLLANATVQEN